jgi:hypothetical protein
MASSNRNIPFSLQYCLWDLFKDFGETISEEDSSVAAERDVSPSRVRNLARAYAWWVAKGAITLDMLKVSCVLSMRFSAHLTLYYIAAKPVDPAATNTGLSAAVLRSNVR